MQLEDPKEPKAEPPTTTEPAPMHCLEDPVFEFEKKQEEEQPDQASSRYPATSTVQQSASEALEKARNRFDKFWGGGASDA